MISTEEDIFGEYSAGKTVVFQRKFLASDKLFFLVFRLLFRYNGSRKNVCKERRHESGHQAFSAGSGGIYPVA